MAKKTISMRMVLWVVMVVMAALYMEKAGGFSWSDLIPKCVSDCRAHCIGTDKDCYLGCTYDCYPIIYGSKAAVEGSKAAVEDAAPLSPEVKRVKDFFAQGPSSYKDLVKNPNRKNLPSPHDLEVFWAYEAKKSSTPSYKGRRSF